MCTATPQEVKDDVKELIDLFGDTGALIIDSTQGIPDEARPENVLALPRLWTSTGCSKKKTNVREPVEAMARMTEQDAPHIIDDVGLAAIGCLQDKKECGSSRKAR